jgi:UDP-glucose 4-epimerase
VKALVTGGAGFIGSHLCDALSAEQTEIWCIDNLYLGRIENIRHLEQNKAFHFIRMDVLDRESLDRLFNETGFDFVYHMAANSDIQAGVQSRDVDLNLTFLTTFSVLECMAKYNVNNLFFASSSAIFGDTDELLHEDSGSLHPISFYGSAKLASESYIHAFSHHYGIKSWILRFPNVVGERCTHGVVNDFVSHLKKDPSRLRILGDGKQNKPYMYVRDLTDAIFFIMKQSDENVSIFHVSNKGLTTVNEIADIIIGEMGLENVKREYSGGNIGWKGDVPCYNYDTSKIEKLGFKLKYSSTEAVRKAVRRILFKE